MVLATNLGFPRIGANRELKKATESYWRGDIDAAELQKTGAELRKRHWQMQKEAGIDHIPSNDFLSMIRFWIWPACWDVSRRAMR